MRRLILTLFLSSLCFAPVCAKQEGRVNFLKNLANEPALKNAQYSVYAKYVGGKDIIVKDKNILFVPASVLKLFTTAAVLDILGPDRVFETKVYYDGKINKGILEGDIYLLGAGDPSFGSKDFEDKPFYNELFTSWAAALKEKGIKKIKGNIYVDNSLFSGVLLPWRASFKNVGNYFAPKADAFTIANNKYKIIFPPTKEGQVNITPVSVEPRIEGLAFKSYVTVSKKKKREDVYVTFEPASKTVNLNGILPLTDEQTEIYAALPNPAKFAAEMFFNTLQDSGIKVLGKAEVKKGEYYEKKELLFSYASPTVAELVKHTNKKSDNLYAGVLLRNISAYTKGDGSAKDGLKKVSKFLEKLGLQTDSFDIYDASGLSYTSNVSCHATVALLENILSAPYAEYFKDSLIIAGNEGEKSLFAGRVKNSPFAFKTLLKTGALDKARTIAGYTKDKKGKDIAFCFFINNFKTKGRNIIVLQDKFLEYLADYN